MEKGWPINKDLEEYTIDHSVTNVYNVQSGQVILALEYLLTTSIRVWDLNLIIIPINIEIGKRKRSYNYIYIYVCIYTHIYEHTQSSCMLLIGSQTFFYVDVVLNIS